MQNSTKASFSRPSTFQDAKLSDSTQCRSLEWCELLPFFSLLVCCGFLVPVFGIESFQLRLTYFESIIWVAPSWLWHRHRHCAHWICLDQWVAPCLDTLDVFSWKQKVWSSDEVFIKTRVLNCWFRMPKKAFVGFFSSWMQAKLIQRFLFGSSDFLLLALSFIVCIVLILLFKSAVLPVMTGPSTHQHGWQHSLNT